MARTIDFIGVEVLASTLEFVYDFDIAKVFHF